MGLALPCHTAIPYTAYDRPLCRIIGACARPAQRQLDESRCGRARRRHMPYPSHADSDTYIDARLGTLCAGTLSRYVDACCAILRQILYLLYLDCFWILRVIFGVARLARRGGRRRPGLGWNMVNSR